MLLVDRITKCWSKSLLEARLDVITLGSIANMVRFSLHLRSRSSFEKRVIVAVSLALLSFEVGLLGALPVRLEGLPCSLSREVDPKTEQCLMDTSRFLPVSFHTQSDP